MFRNLFGARLPRLALHTLLLAMPFAAILAEPALAQNLDPCLLYTSDAADD